MSTITKEWLQQAISDYESVRDGPFVLDDYQGKILVALRIALASLEAEPVALYKHDGTLITFGSFGCDATPDNPIPLYAIQPADGDAI